MEVNFMKLKVPMSNLVKFKITRVRFSINRRQNSGNFIQNYKSYIEGYRRHFLKKLSNYMCVSVCACEKKKLRDMEGIFKKVIYMSTSECVL